MIESDELIVQSEQRGPEGDVCSDVFLSLKIHFVSRKTKGFNNQSSTYIVRSFCLQAGNGYSVK